MSQHRKVNETVVITTKDKGDVLIKPSKKMLKFIGEKESASLISKALKDDGWEEKKGKLIKENEKGVKVIYDPKKENLEVIIVTIARETVRVANRDEETEELSKHYKDFNKKLVKAYLEKYKEKFIKKYLPRAISEGLIKKAKMIDSNAKVEITKDNDDELSMNISLEVG